MLKIFLKYAPTLFIISLFLIHVGSCSNNQEKKSTDLSSKKVLNIGLIPEHDLFTQKKRFAPLAEYLTDKLGVTVRLRILSRYGNIINNFNSMNLGGAFFGSFTGALAIKKLDVEPIARPVYINGASTYYGIIFARKDSGIKNGAHMRGKRFAFVDKATTAGWLLPMYYFKKQGIKNYRTWFIETYFTGTHEDAIYDVMNGKADIGAAKNTVFDRLVKTDNSLLEKLTILATSPKVPANGLVARSDLDQTLKEKIKSVLLQMDKNNDGRKALTALGAAKFIETNVEDFNPVFEYAESIGLDLSTYDYINE